MSATSDPHGFPDHAAPPLDKSGIRGGRSAFSTPRARRRARDPGDRASAANAVCDIGEASSVPVGKNLDCATITG